MTPLPPPLPKPFSQLSAPLTFAGGPGAGPEAQSCQPLGGHLDDHTTLLFEDKRGVRQNLRTGARAPYMALHTCGWQQQGDVGFASHCRSTPDAFLVQQEGKLQ